MSDESPVWRFFIPVVGTAGLSLFGWGVSVEMRLTNMSATQEERAPLIAKLEEALHDPVMKPDVKSQFEQDQQALDKMDRRIDRLEERFNNFHTYLLQARPTVPVVPPSKRGEGPFKLEDRG